MENRDEVWSLTPLGSPLPHVGGLRMRFREKSLLPNAWRLPARLGRLGWKQPLKFITRVVA